MARIARIVIPGCPHHVTQRGNRRQKTFFRESDYQLYVYLMSEFCRKAKTEVWAYCLMPNHVHFVMVPRTENGLRDAIGEAHRRYTIKINSRKNWRGHLWQERFRSFPMDESYLLATVRYIELNPVSAKLCAKPELWPWSSASAHLSGIDDILVRTKPMLNRVSDWSEYLQQPNDPQKITDLRIHSNTGRPLGSESFVARLSQIVGCDIRPKKRGRKLGYRVRD